MTATGIRQLAGYCDRGVEQDVDMLGPWRGQPRSVACRACHRGLELRAA